MSRKRNEHGGPLDMETSIYWRHEDHRNYIPAFRCFLKAMDELVEDGVLSIPGAYRQHFHDLLAWQAQGSKESAHRIELLAQGYVTGRLASQILHGPALPPEDVEDELNADSKSLASRSET